MNAIKTEIVYMQNWHADSLFMIENATLAPSGHNTQPWIFMVKKGEITICPDFSRRLPVVDGDNRELFISLGCAVENLCLAASVRKYRANVTVSASGQIAIELIQDANIKAHPLFEGIARRQTNRGIYSGKSIAEDVLAHILRDFENDHAHRIHLWPRASREFEALAQCVMQGNAAQMNDPAFKAELLAWIRFNRAHAQRTRDGLSYAALGAPSLPAWLVRPIVKGMLNEKKQNATDRRKIDSSSHLVLISSVANHLVSWIETGRVLQRFLLQLTQAGIAHAYLNQPCEVPALQSVLRAQWLNNASFAQILLRIGYGKPLPHALRRPVQAVMREVDSGG